MRVDLVTLLRTRPIVHPSSLSSAVLQDGTLSLTIGGYGWWRETPRLDDRLTLFFEDISDGVLGLTLGNYDDNEVLEFFTVEPVADLVPSGGQHHQVFCSGPIPDPIAIYAALENYLDRGGAYWRAAHYLNCGDSLGEFQEVASAESFLLGRGPDAVRDLLAAHLVHQGVPHNVVTTAAAPNERLCVFIYDNGFLCRAAWAEFGP